MIYHIIKYRILFIILLLSFCSIFIESPYHGDYYKEPPYFFYFLITMTNMLVYLISTDKLIYTEKFLYSGIISCVVLIGVGIFVDKIMGIIYGYDANWDELKSPEILDSALFYFISTFSGIGILKMWLTYRKPIYK